MPILIIFFWLFVVGLYHTHKALPENVNMSSKEYLIMEENIKFLYDLSYEDEDGKIVHEQQIFREIFSLINNAQEYILLDMFLFNSYKAKDSENFKELSKELTDLLVKKKTDNPDIKIDLITDPINIVYGGGESREINKLKQAGINVVITDLKKLRDSNFIYSSFWRVFFQWFGNTDKGGLFGHPFSQTEPKVSLRSYLSMINFKANHRKLLVTDNFNDMVSVVASANPHGGSSRHSNVAMLIRGDLWQSIYKTEQGIANMSGTSLQAVEGSLKNQVGIESDSQSSVSVHTEDNIKNVLLEEINNSHSGDRIKIAQFYFSHQELISALVRAANRGVKIQLILDANKDAFGYKKIGIPNKQTARELMKKTDNKIDIRWYKTHGEQFHSKMVIFEKEENFIVVLGSANLTRRNIDNYNLELNVSLSITKKSKVAQEIMTYFARIWNNKNGNYTLDYEKLKDDSWIKIFIYKIQEMTGLSSF